MNNPLSLVICIVGGSNGGTVPNQDLQRHCICVYSPVLLWSCVRKRPGFRVNVGTHGADLGPVSSLKPSPADPAGFHWTRGPLSKQNKFLWVISHRDFVVAQCASKLN